MSPIVDILLCVSDALTWTVTQAPRLCRKTVEIYISLLLFLGTSNVIFTEGGEGRGLAIKLLS